MGEHSRSRRGGKPARSSAARPAAEPRPVARPPAPNPPAAPPQPGPSPQPRARSGRATTPLFIGVGAAVVVIVLLAVAMAVLVARGGGGAGGPPAAPAKPTVSLSAVPTDAVIVVGTRAPATGTVVTDDIAAGAYPVTVSRAGFAPVSATLTVKASGATKVTYALKPYTQTLTVAARPAKATVTVRLADGRTLTDTGSFSKKLVSGPVRVSVTAPGYKPLQRSMFLDAPTRLDLWLDPVGQVVHMLGVYKSVPAPKGIAVTPDGSQFWVTALVSKPSIEAYDLAGRVLGKVTLGNNGAVEVVFNRDGSKAYASQMQSASVFEIDTKTFRVLRQFKTGSSWTKMMAFSPDEKKLYAANWVGDDISEIDLATGKLLRRFPTVDTPRGLWPTADGKRLFVAGFGENSLTGRLAVIDLATGKSKTFLTVKGGAMRHMVADEKRGLIFTSDMGKRVIWATDMKSLKTWKWADTDSHPNTIDLSPDGKVLFVSCRGANNPVSYYQPGPEWESVLLYDTANAKMLDAVVGGNQCTALDLSPDGRTLVFSDFLDNRMRIYEIPPYRVLAAGKGGRSGSHLTDVRKPGWSDSGGGSSGGD